MLLTTATERVVAATERVVAAMATKRPS